MENAPKWTANRGYKVSLSGLVNAGPAATVGHPASASTRLATAIVVACVAFIFFTAAITSSRRFRIPWPFLAAILVALVLTPFLLFWLLRDTEHDRPGGSIAQPPSSSPPAPRYW